MTDTGTPAQQDPTSGLVDRVRREMARRRALTDALRPPKRRAQARLIATHVKPPKRSTP